MSANTVYWSSISTSEYMPKRIESKDSYRYLYPHAQNNIICNSQKVETTQVTMDRWRSKHHVVYITMEYFWALKRKEIMMIHHAWILRTQFHLYEVHRVVKFRDGK